MRSATASTSTTSVASSRRTPSARAGRWTSTFFFFKQKTAYEIGLGIPAEPLFRSRQMTTSTTSIDIMGLQAAYANLHTDQERDYFMQRYHDVISSFGGKTSYDADNRPLLVMRSNLWASGYDVDG